MLVYLEKKEDTKYFYIEADWSDGIIGEILTRSFFANPLFKKKTRFLFSFLIKY